MTTAATAISAATTTCAVMDPSAQAAAFARDGYLLLRNLLPDARLAPLRNEIDARVAAIRAELTAEDIVLPAPAASFAHNLVPLREHLTRYGRSWTAALADAAVHHLYQAPELLVVMQELLGERVCGHQQFNLRPKLPGQELTTVPWHQDTAYYGPQSVDDTILTVWLPLVTANAHNGCLQIVPGSHRRGAVAHDAEVGEGQFLQLRATPDPATVLTVEMQPGDVLVMHNLLWHCSTHNHSDGIRWSIDLRYFAPDTPNAAMLVGQFPRPWLVAGGAVAPLAEWRAWYASPG